MEENVLDQIYTPQKDNATQTHTIPSLCFIIYSFPKWNLQLHATAVTALFMCVRVLRTCYGISEPWPSLWGVCWTLQRKRKMTRSSAPGEISCHSSRPSGSAASCLLCCSTRLWPLTPPEQKHILRRIAVLVSALSRLVTWPLWPDVYSQVCASQWFIVEFLNGC